MNQYGRSSHHIECRLRRKPSEKANRPGQPEPFRQRLQFRPFRSVAGNLRFDGAPASPQLTDGTQQIVEAFARMQPARSDDEVLASSR